MLLEYTINYPSPVKNENNMHTTALLSRLGELRDIWKAGRSCLSSPRRIGDSALEVLPLTVVWKRQGGWRA
jgi:hypothetical protein